MPVLPRAKRKLDGQSKHLEIPNRQLVIGIDLGTTASGISYAYTANPKDQVDVSTWPTFENPLAVLEGKINSKVPT